VFRPLSKLLRPSRPTTSYKSTQGGDRYNARFKLRLRLSPCPWWGWQSQLSKTGTNHPGQQHAKPFLPAVNVRHADRRTDDACRSKQQMGCMTIAGVPTVATSSSAGAHNHHQSTKTTPEQHRPLCTGCMARSAARTAPGSSAGAGAGRISDGLSMSASNLQPRPLGTTPAGGWSPTRQRGYVCQLLHSRSEAPAALDFPHHQPQQLGAGKELGAGAHALDVTCGEHSAAQHSTALGWQQERGRGCLPHNGRVDSETC
jgi:hypothetical protein